MKNKTKVDNQLISSRGIVKKPGKTRKNPEKTRNCVLRVFAKPLILMRKTVIKTRKTRVTRVRRYSLQKIVFYKYRKNRKTIASTGICGFPGFFLLRNSQTASRCLVDFRGVSYYSKLICTTNQLESAATNGCDGEGKYCASGRYASSASVKGDRRRRRRLITLWRCVMGDRMKPRIFSHFAPNTIAARRRAIWAMFTGLGSARTDGRLRGEGTIDGREREAKKLGKVADENRLGPLARARAADSAGILTEGKADE